MRHDYSLPPSSNGYLVAVSGGPDSMALLDLLRRQGYRLIVAHVNYQTRGVESEHEQSLVAQYCHDHNLVFRTIRAQQGGGGNRQDYYRRVRFSFFLTLAKEHQTNYLLVAHHRDDLLETLLIQKRRATPLVGLPKTSHYKSLTIIRPLLEYFKEQLVGYCREFQVPFAHDSSNYQTLYLRNRIRQQVGALNEDQKNQMIEQLQCQQPDDDSLKMRIIDLFRLQQLPYPSASHLAELTRALQSERSHLLIKVANGHYLERSYGTIAIVTIDPPFSYVIKEPVSFEGGRFRLATIPPGEPVLLQDDWFPLRLCSYTPGLRLLVNGHPKKVSRFYIDNKIPHPLRRQLPLLVAADGMVVSIPGLYQQKIGEKSVYSRLFYGTIDKVCQEVT